MDIDSKGGMSFEDAHKRRGSKLVYLREPWLNLVVADKYRNDTSCAWIEIAKFFASLTSQKKAQKISITMGADVYYWMSYNLIISRLWHYGIRSKSTVSRALFLLCNPSNNQLPLLKRIDKRDSNGHPRLYYAKTDAFDDLFDTDPEWASQNIEEFEQKEEDDSTDDVFDEPTPEPAKPQFPDWFEEQWGILVKSKFPSAKQYKSDGVTPNKYALDFAEAVQEIVDGTFYKGKGKTIKDKSIDIPEGLSVEDVIEAVLNVENKFITNPYSAILLVTKTVCFSPVLKWFDSGNKPAKKTTVVKHSIRSKVRYTEEQQNTVKPIKYLWDQVLKTDPETGRVMESMQGALSDGWIQRHGLFKKFDLRIANFYADMCEAYEGLSVRKPDIFKALETLEDMAKYTVQKGTEQDWKDKFWEFIDTLPIYTDSPIWTWFVNRYEELFGGVICDMAKFKNSRNRAEIQSQMDGFKEFMEE